MFRMNAIRLRVLSPINAGTLPVSAPVFPIRSHLSHDRVLTAGILSNEWFRDTDLLGLIAYHGSASFLPEVRIPQSRKVYSGLMRESLVQEAR